MAKTRANTGSHPDPSHSSVVGPHNDQHPSTVATVALTTNQGMTIGNPQDSLRAHNSGPTLLEDFLLREKITHFDHERIPERVVHARGSGAHGHFQLHTSLEKYTTAAVLTRTKMKTPVFARFSTVCGGAGSADTPRDIRGFAVKFYTTEGNWDLVGNNVPVFFIQDAIKFPDLIHAVKMEPDCGFPQAASAHDSFWDFISCTPEATHAVMWAMSDRTLPRSLRMIEGFGVHSFRLLSARGESTFVKFRWRPHLGLQSQVWDEAVKIAGADSDYHRRDLFEAIAASDFPRWELLVQLFNEEQASSFPFDHLDPTKLIPEELVPWLPIGTMTLDRNPTNFFAETEQVAFCPANLVPGMDFSNDPLLQGRLFSYLDTQLSRLGSPNFHQLPINAPRVPIVNFLQDGQMQLAIPEGQVNYEPSTREPIGPGSPSPPFRSFVESSGESAKGRLRPASFSEYIGQAAMFYRSLTSFEQSHVVAAFTFELSKVESVAIRGRIVARLRLVDESLAIRVAQGLGLSPLPPAEESSVPIPHYPGSSALRTIHHGELTLAGRCVAIVIDEGSDAPEIGRIVKAVEHSEATTRILAPKIGGATLSDGTRRRAEGQLSGSPSVLFDAVVLLPAAAAVAGWLRDASARDFARDAFAHLKAIGVNQHGRRFLHALGVDCDDAVVDVAEEQRFLDLAATRQWDRECRIRPLF